MNSNFIEKATSMVEANLSDENFGPEQLAEKLMISHTTLHRRMKQGTEKTISQFIRDIRLEKACSLLLHEESTVSEIAYKVGFSSATYFNRCFHEKYACSPGEYKKKESELQMNSVPSVNDSKNRKQILFIAVIVILVAATFLVLNQKYAVFGKKQEVEKSIAVLPVQNLGNQDSQYIADGIGEAIKDQLSKIEDLRVVDISTVKEYFADKTEKEIGNELNIGALLKISFQKVNEEFVLFVSLINAGDGTIVFSEKYPSSMAGIYAMQSKIAQTIAQELHADISEEEKERINSIPTVNITANDYYLRGKEKQWYYWINGDKQIFQESNEYYLKALASDSNYAPIYSGLALLMWHQSEWKNTLPENYLDSILNLADKALELDKNTSDAYFIRGEYYRLKGRNDRALTEYNKALDINPNDWMAFWGTARLYTYTDALKALHYYAEAASRHKGIMYPELLRSMSACYAILGFFEKSNYYSEEAFKLDNDSVQFYNYLTAIESDLIKKISLWEKALLIDLTNTRILDNLFITCSFSNQDSLAFQYVKRYLTLFASNDDLSINVMHRIGYVYLKMGYIKEAKYYFDLQEKKCIEAINSERYYSNFLLYDLAGVYAIQGEKEKAYIWLNRFNKMDKIPFWFVQLIKIDPLFNSIRDEPEFQEIVADMQAKYMDEHEQAKKWLEENNLL